MKIQAGGDLRVAEQRITDRERIRQEGEERMQLPQSAQNEEPVYNELQNIGRDWLNAFKAARN